MRSLLLSISLAAALAPASACKGKGGGRAELPPATGSGAAPLPTLPDTDDPAGEAVAATDDRATGTLVAHAESQLGPNISGVIAEILVEEGDRVKKGDVLFRLDARDAVLRRDQAKAAVEAAKVNLRATDVEYQRTKSLLDQNAVNRAQFDQVQARLDGAKVGVDQAQVALSMANKMVADATVRSPIAGVVTQRLKNEGEMATTMPPTIIVIVQDQLHLDLRFRLPERAIGTLAAGDMVTAHFDAVGLTRTAKIARVNPTVDVRSRTIEVVAEVDNADLALRAGLLASVDLGAAKAEAPAPPPAPGPAPKPTPTPAEQAAGGAP